MSNDPDFIQYVCDQITDDCDVSYRHMFGGTTLYSKGKVVALICDNQLFVKPPKAGRAYIGVASGGPIRETNHRHACFRQQKFTTCQNPTSPEIPVLQ